jgi:hypothetical protein
MLHGDGTFSERRWPLFCIVMLEMKRRRQSVGDERRNKFGLGRNDTGIHDAGTIIYALPTRVKSHQKHSETHMKLLEA